MSKDILGRERETLWVKGSGWDLATIEAPGFPGLDLVALRELRALESMTDEDMVREMRRCMFDPTGPSPSVETLLHAFLPHQFVLHSHADAILAVSNREGGRELCQKLFGSRVAYLDFVMPGFPLSIAVADAVEANPDVEGVFLHQHGLFTFDDNADRALALHREFVGIAAETYAAGLSATLAGKASKHGNAEAILSTLRGRLCGQQSMVLETRSEPWMLAALEEDDAQELLVSPVLTPDHSLRTKNIPCWVDPSGDVVAAVDQFEAEYKEYFSRCEAQRSERTMLDPGPRVLLIPGVGVVGVGVHAKAASIASDLAEHTVLTKMASRALGAYQGLDELDLFDMEYWSLEQAKLGKKKPAPLEGKVALITGGAGAIGEGIGEVLAAQGAAIALVDRDVQAAEQAAQRLQEKVPGSAVLAIEVDVTCEESTAAGLGKVTQAFGGVDIFVPNAGIAHVAAIQDLTLENWQRVMDVNQTGAFLTMKAAAVHLKRQGTGGSIVLISSKNVPAPGADFSAYSSSKAGAHQLARVAALELAGDGITVNMICPDAVFRHEGNSSGLWAEVGPDRAKAKGFSASELEDHYRDRCLMGCEVTAQDVGRAVLFFATHQTPTTGASLPVDGGVAAAFSR